MNRGLLCLVATSLVLALSGASVVYPEHYAKDPGAGFPVVLLKDVAEPTAKIRAFAEHYGEAVFVCAKGMDRTALLAGLRKDPRLFTFPRGRIEIASSDLDAPNAADMLRNYFKWGRYQAETPKLTRYGARLYRADRIATAAPVVNAPPPWRVVEGDDGETGCDTRLAYFTIEADGEDLSAPEVDVSWPGVVVSSVDGAKGFRKTQAGFALTPTAWSGGANYLTMVKDGMIELALHHHVEGAQHGPYDGRPLPWTKIRASDNWRAACHVAFKAVGLDDANATDGADIKLYGFDSNFPRRHVDYPEHFHVMLEWDGWSKNNVGHYTLDERGLIRGNNFLVCGDIAGGLAKGYHPQKPGETTEYVGPSGRPVFSIDMLEGGVGLVLHKPGSDAVWRISSDNPAESVKVCIRTNNSLGWKEIDSVSVVDDTERGLYTVRHECLGHVRRETYRYDRDTGRLTDPPAYVAAEVEAVVPDAYRAQWNDKVNAEIDARIEKWRKADGVFQVGAPGGTDVSVEQVSHAFQFGSHIFNFDQLGRDGWNDEYKAVFTNLWNAATVPFYWREMEPSEGAIRYGAGERDGAVFWNSVGAMSAKDKAQFAEYRRPAPDPILDFCEANGISPHGHVMIYPPFHPAWTTNGVDTAVLARRYERRIRQLGVHYGDRLPQWDVVNESVDRSCTMAGPFHDKVCWSRPNMLVPEDYTFLSYKWAAESFPCDVKFVINDSWRDIYVPFVQQLIDRGAKIDIVGIQMHIFSADQARKIAAGEPCLANGTSWAPEDQIAMLRKLDTLGRPIHLSEITIPAFDDSSEGLACQARLARDNYRLWFSWPSIYRITWWNMVDYTYHKESLASGLFTTNMEKKPVYYALDRLINHEWRTHLSVKADEQGRIFFRGFRGKYRLSWTNTAGKRQEQFVDLK